MLNLLSRPRYIFDRVHDALLYRNAPWIAPGAVEFCERHLRKDQIGLEWGSGRSTRWFAERLGHLLSIEYGAGWHAKVNRDIAGLLNVECRFIPLEHPIEEPCRENYDPLPRYVAVVNEFSDDSLDFVVVDGHYRTECVKHALPKLKPGGLLLVDDADWLPTPEWGVPQSWPIVHESRNSYKSTIIWRKPAMCQTITSPPRSSSSRCSEL